MNVKVEGKNVVRHMDLMTHNHGSMPGNTPPWVFLDTVDAPKKEDCQEEKEKKKTACEGNGLVEAKDQCDDKDCRKARRCQVVSYKEGSKKKDVKEIPELHPLIEKWSGTERNNKRMKRIL